MSIQNLTTFGKCAQFSTNKNFALENLIFPRWTRDDSQKFLCFNSLFRLLPTRLLSRTLLRSHYTINKMRYGRLASVQSKLLFDIESGMMSSKLAVIFSSLHFTFYLDLSITISIRCARWSSERNFRDFHMSPECGEKRLFCGSRTIDFDIGLTFSLQTLFLRPIRGFHR